MKMASWAVPKGVPLKPGIKRLAAIGSKGRYVLIKMKGKEKEWLLFKA